MSGKMLLILERSQSTLNYTTDTDGSVTLEGIFTEIGIRNKNNRIYEEDEVIPHVKELSEKVKTNKLLGELDHPKDFDISLSNVSHVVESLTYDPSKKQVLGRIRLLNTTKGKEAQALIKDGIPLHISSRAAGTVDESGKVKIKKLFTYDLVADPGFENAELSRVNESYGFENDDNLFIYEMEEKPENKSIDNMENQNEKFVSVEDFQKYTEYVNGVLENIKESTKPNDNIELVEKLIKYSEHIAERLNKVTDYTEYLSENLDKSISYSNYLAENVNDIKDYTSYIAEELDNSIQYTEHVAEKANQGIEYSEYLGESLEKGIKYTEYVAEQVDKTIKYAEYVAEKVDQNIDYSNYLGESVEKAIKYSEYIAESVNAEHETAVNEKEETAVNEKEEVVVNKKEEVVNEKEEVKYEDSISVKLDKLIEKAESKKAMKESNMYFMDFLTESKKNEFASLSEEKQTQIIEAMNVKPLMSTNQIMNVWESVFVEKRKELNFLDDMPEKYRSKWDNLSEARQQQIIAESKMYTLNTPYTINNFWATRDLRSTQVSLEKIDENKTAAEQTEEIKKEPLVNEAFAADLISRVKFNLGR